MARGDSISHIASLGSGVYLTLQPASGDDWMITAIGDNHNQTYIEGLQPSGSIWYTMVGSDYTLTGGNQSVSSYIATAGWMDHDLQWFIDNERYIRVINSGSSHVFWFMGVKTKD